MKIFGFCCSLYRTTGKSPFPYLVTGYFLVFTAVITNASLVLLYLQHVFRVDTDILGYYLATEGAVQTASMIMLPVILNSFMRLNITDAGYLLIAFVARFVDSHILLTCN
jgi:hypothetical protein